mgnify:CR=1 FL=1
MVQITAFDTMAKAHGYTCPGIALGYKIAVVASRWAVDADDVRITNNQHHPLPYGRSESHVRFEKSS